MLSRLRQFGRVAGLTPARAAGDISKEGCTLSKAFLAGAVGAAVVSTAEALTTERVPHGGGEEVGGRERSRLPLDPREPPLVPTSVVLQDHPELKDKLGHKFFTPVQPGEVNIKWLADGGLSDAYRSAVELAARGAAAAIAKEVEHTGFGRHTKEWGWQLVCVPSRERFGRASDNVIVVSTGMLESMIRHSRQPEASILFLFAHEMGHHVARHGHEQARLPFQSNPPERLLASARRAQQLSWQHEFEADEIAAAALLRAGVSPADLEEGMRTLQAARVPSPLAAASTAVAYWLRDREFQAGQAAAQQSGTSTQPWEEAREELGHGRRAMAAGSVDDMQRVNLRWQAQRLWKAAQDKSAAGSAGSGPGGAQQGSVTVRKGLQLPAGTLASLPQSEAVHSLVAIMNTHPPYEARRGRLRQLGQRADMLMRAADPPTSVGHRPTNGVSVAEMVAHKLERARQGDASQLRWLGFAAAAATAAGCAAAGAARR